MKVLGWLVICGVIPLLLAAIVIPGLLSSRRASNEREASTALKTLSAAEADFRANDRDANGVNDFWTGDVSGLYSLQVKGSELRLIERAVAEADSGPIRGLCWPRRPRQGYFYQAMEADDSAKGETYFQDTGGKRKMGDVHHLNKFGFCTYPESDGTGKFSFIVNENNTIFRVENAGHITRWPDDTLLKSWST
jgi:type II secretory pathway pseudopilin PulG